MFKKKENKEEKVIFELLFFFYYRFLYTNKIKSFIKKSLNFHAIDEIYFNNEFHPLNLAYIYEQHC